MTIVELLMFFGLIGSPVEYHERCFDDAQLHVIETVEEYVEECKRTGEPINKDKIENVVVVFDDLAEKD